MEPSLPDQTRLYNAVTTARRELGPDERLLILGERKPELSYGLLKLPLLFMESGVALVAVGCCLSALHKSSASSTQWVIISGAIFCFIAVVLVPLALLSMLIHHSLVHAPTVVYAVTNERLLKIENGAVQEVAPRSAIKKIASDSRQITLSLESGKAIQLDIAKEMGE